MAKVPVLHATHRGQAGVAQPATLLSDATPGRRLLGWAALWLLVLMTLGLYMRSAFVWPRPLLVPFTYLLHSHSHTAYFGWAGLGLMGLMLELLPRLTGAPVAAPGAVRLLVRTAPAAVAAAMASFLAQGYGPVSIAMATLNQLLWYLFAWVFWRSVRHLPLRRWPPALLLLGAAVAYLLVSSAGTWLLVALTFLHVQDPVWSNAGLYLFLHAYSDGWLELGALGAAAVLLPRVAGAAIDRPAWLRWQAGLALVLTLPAFLRLLIPFGLRGPLAWLGLGAGALMVVPAGLFLAAAGRAWRQGAGRRGPGAPWLVAAAVALAARLATDLFPLVPAWVQLAGARAGLVGYLHLKLLGFFTAALVGFLAVEFRTPGARAGRWAAAFAVGAIGLAAVLLAMAVPGVLGIPGAGPALQAAALAFSALAAAAVLPVAWPVAATVMAGARLSAGRHR